MEGLTTLQRPFGPNDLRPLIAANGVDATVLIQAKDTVEETYELLQTAADTDFVAGVVGWVDLGDPQMAATLQEIIASENGSWLKGIRPMLQDESDENWLLQETAQANLDAVAQTGIVFDLLVTPRELPAAITTVRDFPHLRFVVDHLAKPPIASGETEPWASLMNEFAGLENVACKLSGMVSVADPVAWKPADFVPYVTGVYNIFGPDRLMFGTDWPVCTLAAEYGQVIDALREVLTDLGVLDEAIEAAIFGNTAIHWYSLNL